MFEMITLDPNLKRSGIHCEFYPIDTNIGLKLFKFKSVAIKEMEKQEYFYFKDIAPKVFDFHETRINMLRLFGFFTQIATLPRDLIDIQPLKSVEWYLEYSRRFEKTEQQLRRNFYNITGRSIYDMHEDNWGYIEGKPVIIDFSQEHI